MNLPELDLSVLKVVLENKKYASEFASGCEDKIFSPDLWRFGRIVIDYLKIYKEIPTQRVLTETFAKNNPTLSKYIDTVYESLLPQVLNEKEFKHNLKKLKDRYAAQLLVSVKDSISAEGDVDIQKTVQSLQAVSERVRGLYKSKIYDQKTLKESIGDFRQRYIAKAKDPNFGRGILTGYNFIDFQTNGLRPAELFLVAGESGSGKSMLLMNLAIQMWLQNNKTDQFTDFKKGYNVLYFSLEMPHEQCLNRVLSRVSDVPYRGIRDGNLLAEDTDKLQNGIKFVKNYPYEFEIVDIPRGATAEQLELIYNDAKLKFEPDVIIVDYLGLMEYEGEMDDWLKLGKISEKLHEFARMFNVVVLSAVQLNRTAGKSKEQTSADKIGQHRIGRSALIIQNANIAMQIEKRDDEGMHPDMILHFIKNRDGELVKGRLLKNFTNCSLINDYGDGNPELANSDDIEERLRKLQEDGTQ